MKCFITILLFFQLNIASSQYTSDYQSFENNIYRNDKRVRHFFIKNNLQKADNFNDLHATCKSLEENSSDSYIECIYTVDFPITTVWNQYTKGNLKKMWSGKILTFCCSFIPSSDSLIFNNKKIHKGIKEGQIVVTKLRLAGGLVKLVVGHKINIIDEENHILEFCYMEGGKTEGSQILEFESIDQNQTKIIHKTIYKGHSRFRDKRLYPKFHTLAVNELHKNVQIMLNEQKKSE